MSKMPLCGKRVSELCAPAWEGILGITSMAWIDDAPEVRPEGEHSRLSPFSRSCLSALS